MQEWYLEYSYRPMTCIFASMSFFHSYFSHLSTGDQLPVLSVKEMFFVTSVTIALLNKIFIKVVQSVLNCFILPRNIPSSKHKVIKKYFTYLLCSFNWRARFSSSVKSLLKSLSTFYKFDSCCYYVEIRVIIIFSTSKKNCILKLLRSY